MDSTERRTADREPRRLPVTYRIKGEDRRHTGFLKDISATGVFIGTPKPLPRGTEIEVLIEDEGMTLEVEAVVARKVWIPPDLRLLGSPGFGARLLTASDAVEAVQGAPGSRAEAQRSDESNFSVVLGNDPITLERQLQDLENGGVFVPTAEPPELNHEVEIDFRVGDAAGASVRAAGTVVQRIAAGQGPQVSPGIGVQLHDAATLLAQLRPHLGLPEPSS